MMPSIRACLLIVPLLLSVPIDATAAAEESASPAILYTQHRQSFQQQRQELATRLDRLDAAIVEKRARLQALNDQKSQLEKLLAEKPAERLRELRAITRRIESATVLAFQPLPVFAAQVLSREDEGAPRSGLLAISEDRVSGYLSFLLPASILLAFFVARRRYPGFYAARRRPAQLAVLALLLLLPLSSLAQESSQTAQSAAASRPAPFTDMLQQADELLGLSQVQRHIRQLSAPAAEGKRLLIADVDLSATPFTYFDTVVGGTGEYYATLAALHLADGNRPAAIEQFHAFARADTVYPVKTSDPQRYESLIASSVVFLMRSETAELAERILRLHMPELRSRESFELIYPELLGHALTMTAAELAQQIIDQTSATEELIDYAATLYANGSEVPAAASLYKALRNVESGSSLEQIIGIGLENGDENAVETAVLMAHFLMDDLAVLVGVADRLRESGRDSAAVELLQDVIARTAGQDVSRIDGEEVSTTEALTFLSYQSFERGLLDVAEKAAVAAIKPLSRAERSELLMPAPPGVLDPMRVPEPEKLVAPLYFGLLYENQGRPDAAKLRFAAESRALIERMLVSDGLYEPDMLNHLSLLGSSLSREEESAELLRLDRVLVRLERGALDELRATLSEEIDRRKLQLDSTEAEIATLRTEIDALEQRLEERGTNAIGVALSAILLTLRNLSLLGVCAICVVAIVALALRYAENNGVYQSYAFWWKLVEGMGWIWVLSVFSAPLGILAIVTAQFFLLYQLRSEQLLAEAPPTMPADPRRGEPPVEPPMGPDWDSDWENVIQVMRETKNRGAV